MYDKKTTIVNINAAMLFTVAPDGNKSASVRLTAAVIDDCKLGVSVHYNYDNKYENISHTFYSYGIYQLLEMIKEEIDKRATRSTNKATVFSLDSVKVYNDNRKTGTLHIKVDDDNIWKLLLEVPGKTKIVFPFKGIRGNSHFKKPGDKNDGELSEEVVSQAHCLWWLNLVLGRIELIGAQLNVLLGKRELSNGETEVSAIPNEKTPRSSMDDDIPF